MAHFQISYMKAVKKKNNFSYNRLIHPKYSCRLINGGGAIHFVFILWELYNSTNQYARQKTLIDVLGASLLLLELSCYTISFIIFLDFSMFYQIFLSPQVKRCAIITYKHGIYELPHELQNDLRLRKILGN